MTIAIPDPLKDVWSLFGRLFPYATKPGLRRAGNPRPLVARARDVQLRADGADGDRAA